MKKILTVLLVFSNTILVFSQTIDTIIKTTILTSYFNYETHNPLFVSYYLYQGGGDCSRKGLNFKTGGLKQSATQKDYAHSGYDIGHMANAEDFANDCEKEKQTFFFYNALPQRAKLNRGCWKTIETKVREQSQTDSLLIICGGYNFKTKVGEMLVPEFCFKVVKNLKTNKTVCYKFPNDDSDTFQEIELSELIKELTFTLNIKK